MILLAFFASQLRDPDRVPRKEYDSVVQERNKLQKEVRDLRKMGYRKLSARQRRAELRDRGRADYCFEGDDRDG